MNELLNCPFCGSEAEKICPMKGDLRDLHRCSNIHCGLNRIGIPSRRWNKRYVCPDSNGDKVYAGDEVEYMWNSGTIKARGKVFWSDFAFWVTQEKMEYLLKDVEHITLIKKEDAK